MKNTGNNNSNINNSNDRNDWEPTHCVVFTPETGERRTWNVMLFWGAAYTKAEWTEGCADAAWSVHGGVWRHEGLITPRGERGRVEVTAIFGEPPLVILRSMSDVRVWLKGHRGDCDDFVIAEVLEQVGCCDHPAWGADWSGWLSVELPRVIEEVADASVLTPVNDLKPCYFTRSRRG